MIRIHYLQHVPFEGLGYIESWAFSRGHAVSSTRLYAGDPFPSIEAFDWLIVMGGPMNVDEEDRYPWLVAEKRFIDKAIDRGITVLGICLGAQLIAVTAGARVYANPHKEIGWFPVHLSPDGKNSSLQGILPPAFLPFHWHGDTFEIPRGATWLAMSNGCRNQAFSLGNRVLALQFHLESTADSVGKLITHCGEDMVPGPAIQQPEAMLAAGENFRESNRLMEGILVHYEGIILADGTADPS